MSDVSPFEPLSAPAHAFTETPLAPLDRRFLARVVDGVAGFSVWIPGVAAMAVTGGETAEEALAQPIALVGIAVSLAALIALTAYQWYLLASRGQTIGKRLLDIRIVKQDGSPVDFVTAVILRNWVMGFVTGIANQLCLGWIVFLVDVLPIFGDERRCLHDRIAGTIVVAD